ncbi:MAG: hypothetical protein KKB88_00530 [Nanoarchaeota archaeon]|nr:hypothetical protein [Nanoarchaeota archaeon]
MRLTKSRKKTIVIGISIFVILIGFLAIAGLSNTFTIIGSENIKYVVPHLAGIKCEIVDTGTSSHSQTDSGYWLIKNNIGINTKLLKNIIVKDYQPDLFGGASAGRPRLKYQICDSTGNSCSSEYTLDFTSTNNYQIRLNDIDLTKNSYFIYTERMNLLFQYKVDPSIITFTYEKYGLNLYSTTGGFKTICTSGCDLSCPTQDVRSKLVYTTKNTLNFLESVNYLEYWVEPSLIGEQYGGTIWDSTKREFCFGGFIYSAGILTMKDGITYTYPKRYSRQLQCCNGASISLTTGGEKVCKNNIWEIINPENPSECISDISCPNQGQPTCTSKLGSYYKSGYSCISGECIKDSDIKVSCCPVSEGCAVDQVCQNYKCVGGFTTPPINQTGNESVKIKCNDCDSYVNSILFGWASPSQKCEKTFLQNNLTCAFSYLKLALALIVLIFASLFGFGLFNDLLENSVRKEKTRKIIALILGLLVAGILSILTYFLFTLGIIIFIIFIAVRFGIKFFIK